MSVYSVGSDPDAIALGDFDGVDGLDIVTNSRDGDGNADDKLTILFNQGGGLFSSSTGSLTISGLREPSAIAVGDLDSQNGPDIALSGYTNLSTHLTILLNNGDGTFASPSTLSSGGRYPASIGLGEFNGSPGLDAVTGNEASQSISIFVNDGAGSFSHLKNISAGFVSGKLVVDDFDGSNNDDVALADKSNSRFRVWLNNGSAGFSNKLYNIGDGTVRSIVSGDFDEADGPDLAVAINSTDRVFAYMNDGTGLFNLDIASPYSVEDGPMSLSVADFDQKDGPDLAVACQNLLDILLNN